MYAALELFSWSMELLAFATPCLHLQYWNIYYICQSNPFFLVSERSGRTARYAKRLVHLTFSVSSTSFSGNMM